LRLVDETCSRLLTATYNIKNQIDVLINSLTRDYNN